jgi:hypothetical protein
MVRPVKSTFAKLGPATHEPFRHDSVTNSPAAVFRILQS